MKRITVFLLLLLLLCGCAAPAAPTAVPTPEPEPLWTTALAEELLESGAFTDSEMAPIEPDLVALLLGLDEASIIEGVSYMAVNTASSADELHILVLTDEAAAEAAQKACETRRENQLKVCRDYCPAAVPRLEKAVISRRGNTLLFAVGDPDLLAGLLGG